MVLRNADRILTARILLAHVHAAVRHPVAELLHRTVPIVDARYRLAALGEIVRIAGIRPRWTLALGSMVVRYANGKRTTLDTVTGRTAGQCCSILRYAMIRFGTLRTRQTGVVLFRSAAISIVRITGIAG
uniref:Putative secreted peptide n=1 Tax=Anopheles braziliensis TaxID=58242 RepID=A0A2M3ZSQ5_9DIPT